MAAAAAAKKGRPRGTATPPGKNSRPNKATSAVSTEQRAQAVFDALSIPVAGIAMAAQASGSQPLLADAIVIGKAAPALSIAIAQVADQDDRVARIVDSLVQTGPYAVLFTALMPVVLQIAANHSPRIAEATGMMGTKSPADIVAGATVKGEGTEDE